MWYVDFRYQDPVTLQSKRFKRSTGQGTTKKEALELERTWRRQLEAPPEPVVIKKEAAFSGFAKRFLDVHIKTNRKHSYYRSTETVIRVHLVPFFGDEDLRSIDAEDIARYKAEKIKQVAPKTLNNQLGVLSILFRKAKEWGYVERNPVTGVGLMRIPPKDMKFWDAQQSAAFLEAVARVQPDWHPFFLCALRTGMRLGELFALRWDDVDFVKRRIHVVWNYTCGTLDSPKNHQARLIPISAELGQVLKAHRHLRGPLVFCQDDGSYLTRDIVKHPFARGTRKAGLRTIRLHDLRHSFASQLVMAGVPLSAVKELLGHSTLEMTMRYAHLSPEVKHDYVNRLDVGGSQDWSQNGPIGDQLASQDNESGGLN